jgi:hypothetical protein
MPNHYDTCREGYCPICGQVEGYCDCSINSRINKVVKKEEEKVVENKTLKNIIHNIRDNFFTRLDGKTGWGKNDIKKEFMEAITDELINTIDKEK